MSLKLIILDFDNVLFHRVKNGNKRPNSFRIKRYEYYPYPSVINFLEELTQHYHIGFFTSITEENSRNIIKKLIPKHIRYEFILDRRFVKFDPSYWNNSHINQGNQSDKNNYNNGGLIIKDYDTVKYLTDVFNNPNINERRLYNHTNTIIIDDSYMKMRFNNVKNVILFYHEKNLTINDKLEEKLYRVNGQNVRKYCKFKICRSYEDILSYLNRWIY